MQVPRPIRNVSPSSLNPQRLRSCRCRSPRQNHQELLHRRAAGAGFQRPAASRSRRAVETPALPLSAPDPVIGRPQADNALRSISGRLRSPSCNSQWPASSYSLKNSDSQVADTHHHIWDRASRPSVRHGFALFQAVAVSAAPCCFHRSPSRSNSSPGDLRAAVSQTAPASAPRKPTGWAPPSRSFP